MVVVCVMLLFVVVSPIAGIVEEYAMRGFCLPVLAQATDIGQNDPSSRCVINR
jgi:membrane protease YdiL (CAAX protease family)